jgi:hypothetical protein
MDSLADVRHVLSSQFMNVETSLTVNPQTFLSSISLTIAGGVDSLSSGVIRYSYEPQIWTPVGSPTFQYGCLGIIGNGRSTLQESFFVAVGGDTRPAYTIQWSTDGSNWFPSQSGGFSNGITANIRRANSVAYNKNLNPPFGRWIVSGEDSAGSNTVKYSDDGKNWINGINGPNSNAFSMTTLQTGTKSLCYNIAITEIFNYRYAQFFISENGINWSNLSNAGTNLYSAFTPTGNIRTGIAGNKEQFAYADSPGQTIWFADPDISPLIFTGKFLFTTSGSDILTIRGLSNIYFANPYWISFGSNKIYYTSTFIQSLSNFPKWQSSILNTTDIALKSLNYNSNSGLWIAGAASLYSNQTLWYSYDRFNWNSNESGGFTTKIGAFGKGYCVAPTDFTERNSYNFIGGTGAFNEFSGLDSQIFLLGNIDGIGIGTLVYLTESNAANVFKSQVRGIYSEYGYNPNYQFYQIVAVGDGDTPQKTIARAGVSNFFDNSNRWVPIITGGFSTIGYGVAEQVFFSGFPSFTISYRWIAVGEHETTRNTIQVSQDTANWIGVNNTNAIRQGGRGVSIFGNTIVVVGKDSNTSNTIIYATGATSNTNPTFQNILSAGFSVQGNAVAGGNTTGATYIAVGEDINPLRTILRTTLLSSWSNINSGGFDKAGYGIGFALIYNSNTGNFTNVWIAVGEDSDPSKTIQRSTDGINFTNTDIVNPFTKAGYAVAYTNDDIWIACGEDANGDERGTIKWSTDGLVWRSLFFNPPDQRASYFKSETQTGQALSLFTQQYEINETFPYLELSNLILYERYASRGYTKPTIRTTSSNLYLNEVIQVNQSNQVIVGSPVDSLPYNTNTVLTINGGIITSSLIYEGSVESLGSNVSFSNLRVSSFFNQKSATFSNLITPSLTINTETGAAANNIELLYRNISFGATSQFTKLAGIQKTLYVTSDLQTRNYVGIGISTTYQTILPELYVEGTTVFSTLSTAYLSFQSTVSIQNSNGFSFQSPYIQFFQGDSLPRPISTNTVRTDFSSMTINNMMTLNISTKRIGIFTSNPQFDLDVRINGVLNSLSSPINICNRLFLTLQSV